MLKIESAVLKVEINQEAELQSVFDKKRNKECLWQGDTKYGEGSISHTFSFYWTSFSKGLLL